jgi:hypothetical protein
MQSSISIGVAPAEMTDSCAADDTRHVSGRSMSGLAEEPVRSAQIDFGEHKAFANELALAVV